MSKGPAGIVGGGRGGEGLRRGGENREQLGVQLGALCVTLAAWIA